MDCLKNFEEMVMKELETVIERGELNPSDVQNIGEAVDIVKDLYTIDAMKHSEYGSYSQDDGYMSYGMRGNSYRMYDDRVEPRSSYRNGYGRGYAMDDSKSMMIRKLEDMIDSAGSDKERKALMQCLEKIER